MLIEHINPINTGQAYSESVIRFESRKKLSPQQKRALEYAKKPEKFPAEKVISIYCSGKDNPSDISYQQMEKLGAALAQNGYGVLTGAGSKGSMNAANKGCFEAGGHSIGVTSKEVEGSEGIGEYLDELYRMPNMAKRFKKYNERSNPYVSVVGAGGVGTLEELTKKWVDILCNPDLAKKAKIILYGQEHWSNFYNWLKSLTGKYIPENRMKIIELADEPEQVVEIVKKCIGNDSAKPVFQGIA